MKAIINKAEFDALSDDFKKLYKQQGTEDRFVMQVEGLNEHPDTQGLRSALQTERTNRETRDREIRELREKIGDLDPDEARKAQQRLRELEDQAQLGNIPEQFKKQFEDAVAARVAQMERDFKNKEKSYEKRIGDLEKAHNDVSGQLAAVTIEDEIRREGVKQGLHDWAIEDAVLRGRNAYVLENGKPVRKDNGQVVYGKKPSEPQPISEWLGDLVGQRPGWQRESAGSGAQNNGNQNKGGQAGVHMISRADAQDSMKYAAAKEAAQKAGQRLMIEPMPGTPAGV